MNEVGGSTAIRDEAAGTASQREADFAQLLDGQLERSFRIARLMLRNDADAEDATQDAVTAAWQQWHRLKDRDRFDAWFGRILVNRCRDRLRRRARSSALDVGPGATVESAEADTERRIEIGRAFDALNADQRAVVVLRYWADLTVDQIAERVGAPSGTVKSRLHHALERLRAALQPSEKSS